MDPLFRPAEWPAPGSVPVGQLAQLGSRAGEALKAAKQTVAVFESTSAGLVNAALQAIAGASSYTTCGAISYSSKKAVSVLGTDVPSPAAPTDGESYKAAKVAWTRDLARRKRAEVGATWVIAESGACGPTFTFPDVERGFTAIFLSGPIERGLFVESPHANREENMWTYTKLALDLLAECVEEAMAQKVEAPAPAARLLAKEDRYGGVEVEVPPEGMSAAELHRELQQGLAKWKEAGKQGIWLKVPISSAACAGPAVAQGFTFHHAKEDYVLLTRWLPETPSPLPKYGFHQIGVGGVVVNSKDEVLMVKERISPLALYQGSWKLPGGLADPSEHFAETAVREVQEETGITGQLLGIVSIRHSHGMRFGQGDLYVICKLQADNEDIKIDPHELQDARWMSLAEIESLSVAEHCKEPLDGKVSWNNLKMIRSAMGTLIHGLEMPNSRGGKSSMFYSSANAPEESGPRGVKRPLPEPSPA